MNSWLSKITHGKLVLIKMMISDIANILYSNFNHAFSTNAKLIYLELLAAAQFIANLAVFMNTAISW